jgi:YD repeat-containing protein
LASIIISLCGCVSYPASYTDKLGDKTTYSYDSHGNLTQTADALGFTTWYDPRLVDSGLSCLGDGLEGFRAEIAQS